MKYSTKTVVVDYDNKPLTDDGKDLTFKQVIFFALNSTMQGETMSEADKMKCYELTSKVYAQEDVDYSIEEVAFILGRVKKIYNPLIIGRAKEFFENKDQAAKA